MGAGKLHFSRGDAFRERPLDAGRLTGISGIFPIDVPAGLELEVEADFIAARGVERVVRDHQLHVQMRDIGRVRRGQRGQPCGEEK